MKRSRLCSRAMTAAEAEHASPTWLGARWVGLSGLVFCALVVASLVLVNPPEADQSDAAILDYYTDSASRAKEYGSAILVGLGIIAFLVFVTGLRDVLARVVGERSSLPSLAFAGVLAFALF